MVVSLNLIQITILLGALQGILLALALIISGRHKPEKFIGWALLIFTINLIGFVFADVYIYQNYPNLLFLPFSQFLFFGPFFFLYFKSKLTKEITSYDFYWFIPGIIEISFQIILFLNTSETKITISRSHWYLIYFAIENVAGIAYNIYFLIRCIQLLKKHQHKLLQYVSNWAYFKILDYKWMLISLSILIILWMALFISDVLLFDFKMPYKHYHPVYMMMSVFIYWLGYKVFLRRNEETPVISVQNEIPIETPIESKSTDNEIIEKIQKYISTQKPYLDSDLNLATLANQLQMTQKELSGIINQHFKKNFNDFINHYRIEEIKRMLANPEKDKFTIISLAFDAGFNSKSSFNRVFKIHTGLTPKAYKENLSKSIK